MIGDNKEQIPACKRQHKHMWRDLERSSFRVFELGGSGGRLCLETLRYRFSRGTKYLRLTDARSKVRLGGNIA